MMNKAGKHKMLTNDELFDQMLARAVELKIEREYCADTEEDRETNELFADTTSLDRRIMALSVKYERRERNKRLLRNLARSAAVFVAGCIIVATLVIVNVSAYQKAFANFFVNVHKEFTEIVFRGEAQAETFYMPEGWLGAYAPTYLPKGFVIDDGEDVVSSRIYYINTDGTEIIFGLRPNDAASISIDTENADVSTVDINGNNAMLIIDTDNLSNKLMWHNDAYTFSLVAPIGEDELLKLARSVKAIPQIYLLVL
jgi:hypothetical protein